MIQTLMFKSVLDKKLQQIIRYFIHKNNKILYINGYKNMIITDDGFYERMLLQISDNNYFIRKYD